MWSRSYSKTVRGLDAAQLWKVWTDVDNWHAWQGDLDFARLHGPFQAGGSFTLKPKGGPKVRIELVRVEENKAFVDLTRFPLARMYGAHEFNETDSGLEIRTTMSIQGPLSFLWRKLVAENVANGLAEQTDRLIERAGQA